jgi:hypothetical protein
VTVNIGDATAGAGNVALAMPAALSYSVINGANSILNFISTSATQQTIKCRTSDNMGAITINGVGASYLLSNGFTQTASGVVTHTAGTLDTGNFACTWGFYISTSTSTRTITLGSSTITLLGITSGTTYAWSLVATGLTLNAGTSTLQFNGVGSQRMNTAGKTHYDIIVTANATNLVWVTSCTVNNMTRTGAATDTSLLQCAGNFTITGTLTLNGNAANKRLRVINDVSYSKQTLTAANVSCSNVNFSGIIAAGAANWDLSAITGGSGDLGNNTGITFTPAVTQTATGTASITWSTHAWTTRVPLPQDDVVVNNAFVAGRTITLDMTRAGNNVDFSSSTGAPTFSGTLATGGNITLSSNNIATALSINMFHASKDISLTTNGTKIGSVVISGNYFPSNLVGSVTLNDDIDMTGTSTGAALTLGAGTNFISNNKTITCGTFSVSSTNLYRRVDFGTSTINIFAVITATPVDFSTTAGFLTLFATNAIFNFTRTTAIAKTWAGGDNSFGVVNYVVSGSTGSLSITGSNTFKEINFRDASNARSLLFTAGTTTTITNAFNVQGTPGKLMTVGSITAASHTLTDASGVVSCDYLSLSRSTATGGASWYAGANSTNGGNNTGWIFRKAPGSGSLMLTGAGT